MNKVYPLDNFDWDNFDQLDLTSRNEFMLKKLWSADEQVNELRDKKNFLERKLEYISFGMQNQFEDALINRNLPILDCLLEIGLDPDMRRQHHRTALMRAAEFNDTELADLLLKYGADPEAEDVDGESPINICMRLENFDVAGVIARMILFNSLSGDYEVLDEHNMPFPLANRYGQEHSMLGWLVFFGFTDLFKKAFSMGYAPFTESSNCDFDFYPDIFETSSDLDELKNMCTKLGRHDMLAIVNDWEALSKEGSQTEIEQKNPSYKFEPLESDLTVSHNYRIVSDIYEDYDSDYIPF